MTGASEPVDLEHLFKLRLIVARFGEMDAARWWNTGDATRGTAVLGRAGSLLMSRGFPRTHRFAQARLVFEVARARCAEVFDPPGSLTLWKLPPSLEDQFDARWALWLEQRESWDAFFAAIEAPPSDLLESMRSLDLLSDRDADVAAKLRRSAEGRAVVIPGVQAATNETLTLLAAAFSRGEPGQLSVPYARLED